MQRTSLIPAVLLLGAFAAACGGEASGNQALREREREQLEDAPAARPPVAAPNDGVPTLSFAAAEPRASGNGGCNQFGGPYTQNGGLLRFGPLASTRRACVNPAANAQETAYLRALESTTRFAVHDGLLVLYAENQVVARLRRSGG
jgi:heat shock protein HslJ